MKNWLLRIIAIFSCLATYADQPEQIETLSAKVILENTEGYFILSDGSFWKAVGFVKRWRTPSEWWNNTQMAPRNYDCVPNDWYLGAPIEVYSKHGNLDVNEANASNQEILKRCTHLLVNLHTGQVLFAIALHPAEGMIELFNDAYKDGYHKGVTAGRSESYKNATEVYNRGYSDGYKLGYQEGFQALQNNQQPEM